MLTANTDIHKFAQKLVKAGREEVAWEKRKLQWLLEQQKDSTKVDEER